MSAQAGHQLMCLAGSNAGRGGLATNGLAVLVTRQIRLPCIPGAPVQAWASLDCRHNLGRSMQPKVHGAIRALLADLNGQVHTRVTVVDVVMVVTNRQEGMKFMLDAVRSCDALFDVCASHPRVLRHSGRISTIIHVQTPAQTQSLQVAPRINRKASPSADSLIGSLEEWSSGLTAGYAYPFSSMRSSTA